VTQVRINCCQLLVVLKNYCVSFVSDAVVLVPPFLHYYTDDSEYDIRLISDP